MGMTARAASPAAGWRGWLELVRPFSLTAGLVGVLAGAAAAWSRGRADVADLPPVVLGIVAIQAGTNLVNEVHDVAAGLDTAATPRASRAILEGRAAAAAALPGGPEVRPLPLGPQIGAVCTGGSAIALCPEQMPPELFEVAVERQRRSNAPALHHREADRVRVRELLVRPLIDDVARTALVVQSGTLHRP